MPRKPKETARNLRWKYRVRRDRKGNLHIDTLLDGKRLQHYVHSEAAFARWSELITGSELTRLLDGDCACDLSAGDVLEDDGRIWRRPQLA
jgi:hypothetical protein